MRHVVERVGTNHWDPKQIKKDWIEKLAPLMPRTALLNATKPLNDSHVDYTYSEMPVLEEYVKGTVFEEIIQSVPSKIGRCTFISIPPSFCLRYHRDPDYKYHIAIDDLPGNFFYDLEEQKGYVLPTDGYLYRIHARKRCHTAVNSSIAYRTHLVIGEYVCDDSDPNQTYTSKVKLDLRKCIINENIPKLSIGNTIEQAFMVDWISDSYYTHKVFSNSASNIIEDGVTVGREYTITWTCKKTMMERMFHPVFVATGFSLRNVGVDLYFDVGDGYQLAVK